MRSWRWVILLLLAVGCSSPAEDFARGAAARGFTSTIVRGTSFDHVVFRQPGLRGRRVHVYLDGDGTPWLAGLPARDPTPRRTLVLALMARDSAPSLYVGRPCYHGLMNTAGCTGALWTSARYSDTVVESMAAAVRRILASEPIADIMWFGYSGGGTLAMLLAPRFPESRAVITVAANLDTDAWTDTTHVHPLKDSLNPARQPPLPDHIVQIHYAGGRDDVVPVEVVRRGVTGAGRLVVMPRDDHVCCWEKIWTTILEEVEQSMSRVR
jgi:hypothetical protein